VITYDDLDKMARATARPCQCEPEINYGCKACHVEAEREFAADVWFEIDERTGYDIDNDLREWGENWKV